MKKETKEKIKKALKYTGIGLGIGAFAFLGYKYIKNDDGPSEETLKITDEYIKQMEKEKELAYDKGGHDEITRMMMYCLENGKSIVGTASSISNKPEDAQCWLVAELVTEKPEGLEDNLVPNAYEAKMNNEAV